MKSTTLAKSRQNIASSTGVLFLIFFSFGCVDRLKQEDTYQTCKDAEEVVRAAQTQYNSAMQELASGSKDADTLKAVSVKFQSRQDAEEKAFVICNHLID